MPILKHRCVTRKIGAAHPLAGKTIYIPSMAEGSVEAFCAAFSWIGIEAHPTPPADATTLELGGNTPTEMSVFRPKLQPVTF